jgi:protocatechuate 3,4-dioxygenase beta subunit
MLDRRKFIMLTTSLSVTAACRAQAPAARADLYNCEGCEPTFQFPSATLTSEVDVARGEPGEALVLEGVVRRVDDAAPAPGVIVYMHQTNAKGLYANGSDDDQWSRRHGRLRGWAVTDRKGRYRFHTIKPAPYPDMTMPAHIHLAVGEPGRRPYYIDDVVFDGEFKVDADYRRRQELRGGGGIVRLSRDDEGRWLAVRNIVLERHPR